MQEECVKMLCSWCHNGVEAAKAGAMRCEGTAEEGRGALVTLLT